MYGWWHKRYNFIWSIKIIIRFYCYFSECVYLQFNTYKYHRCIIFNLGFDKQPIAHTDGIWNFLGMLLAGFGCVLLGGCPLRQLVLAGEGNSDSAITVLGLIIGAAFAHNFGLASSGNGPTVNGQIAVVIGLIVTIFIAYFNTFSIKSK